MGIVVWSSVPLGDHRAREGSDLSPAAHGGTVESQLVTPLRGSAACDLSSALGTQAESGEGETGSGVVPGGLSSRGRGRMHTRTRLHKHTCMHA